MKTTYTILFLFIFLFSEKLEAQKLQKVWETNCDLKTPESVLYDAENNVIYVANINGNPAEKDGNGFISVINKKGEATNLNWIKKLNAPKGMALFNGKLYVADIDELIEIDIKKGKVENRYKEPNALILNDVTACQNGMIFVSDTETAKIHVLQNGEFKVWFEGSPLEGPNGLMAEKGKLLVGDRNIYEIDILTQKVEIRIENAGGVDGLEKNDNGEFVYSNWQGRIFIHKNGQNIKLLDTVDQKINSADIDYIFDEKIILVPTFFNNKIVAYRLGD